MQHGDALAHGFPVHVDDGMALPAVGLDDGFVQVGDGVIEGDDAGQLEEGGLHEHIDASAEAEAHGDIHGVERVEADLLAGDGAAQGSRQMFFQIPVLPHAVQQEDAAFLDAPQQVVLVHIGLVVAGDEVGGVDEVGRADGPAAEAQVRHGDAAGLAGVVGEIGLRIQVGVVADDLHGQLVRADGAVGAEAPELAGGLAFGRHVEVLHFEGGVGHVVDDAHGEAVAGLFGGQIVEDREGLGGGEVFGGEAVASGIYRGGTGFGGIGVAHVEAQGIAGPGLLGAVEHGDALHGGRDGFQQLFRQEGAVQAHVDHADLLAAAHKLADGLFHHGGAGAHDDDEAIRFGMAVIVEELVVLAGDGVDFVHVLPDDAGQGVHEGVYRFTQLEEHVGVVGHAAQLGMVGVQGAVAESFHGFPVEHVGKFFLLKEFDFLDFVGGTEPVEEVDEGQARLNGGKVGHGAEVHDVLHGAGGQHGEAGLAGGHHVLMVAEDAQGVGGEGARAHMEDRGQEFAGYLVHVGDHQQEPLRGRVGGGESAALQGAVQSSCRAAFGLHLDHAHRGSEKVFLALSRPRICEFRHGRRGGDGKNGGNFRERIGDIGGSGVAVHGLCPAVTHEKASRSEEIIQTGCE